MIDRMRWCSKEVKGWDPVGWDPSEIHLQNRAHEGMQCNVGTAML